MKRWAELAIVAVISAISLGAASFSTSGIVACNTTCSVTVPSTGAGNTGVLFMIDANGNSNVITAVSTGTWSTFSAATNCNNFNVNEGAVSCAVNTNLPGGVTSFTVTVSHGETTDVALYYIEYAGSSGTVDKAAGCRDSSGSTTQSGCTLAITGSNDMIVQCFQLSNGQANSVASPYGNLTNTVGDSNGCVDHEATASGAAPSLTLNSSRTATFGAIAVTIPSGGTLHTAAVQDAAYVLDAPGGAGAHFGLSKDSVAISDLAARTHNALVQASEVLVLADSMARMLAAGRLVTELVPSSTPGSGSAQHFGSVSESVASADLLRHMLATAVIVNEGLNTLDSPAGGKIAIALATENLGVLDSGRGHAGHFGSTAEFLIFIDKSAGNSSRFASAQELAALVESISFRGAHFGTGTEWIGSYEHASERSSRFASASDVLAVVDFGSKSNTRFVTVFESFGTADSGLRFAGLHGSTFEAMPLSDQAVRRAGLHLATFDATPNLDLAVRGSFYMRASTDLNSVTDYVSRLGAFRATSHEAMTVSDLSSRLANRFMATVESLRLADIDLGRFGSGGSPIVTAGHAGIYQIFIMLGTYKLPATIAIVTQ